MLLIVIIVAFILTIALIECSSLFNCLIENKQKIEKIENIYLNDDSSDQENKIELLKKYTGKHFTTLNYNETIRLKLNNTSIGFFEDYDIFIDNTYKLNKMTVYPINKDSIIDIINYTGDIITIYVH